MTSAPRRDRPLVVASYNVHGWVGSDGRYDPERVAAVVAELRADVVALQEVRCPREGRSDLDRLGDVLGAEVVRGITLRRGAGCQGNALLSRLPLRRVECFDLSRRGREPRGAIDATLATSAGPLRIIATHLGMGAGERRLQVRSLLERLGAPASGVESGVELVLGDMNEWVRGVGALLPLHRRLGRTPGPRTFPAPFPLFSLDRIWVAPRSCLRRLWVHRSPRARRASDHLPVLAELELGFTAGEPQPATGGRQLPPREPAARGSQS